MAPVQLANRVKFQLQVWLSAIGPDGLVASATSYLASPANEPIFCPAWATIFASADGADMVDCVTEIPLPGRKLAVPNAPANSAAAHGPLPAFVAGPENRLVAGAIERLMHATTPAEGVTPLSRFAPSILALFGPSGTGKTHLARGLVDHWQQQCGAATAAYLTAAELRQGFHEAIKRRAEPAFRAALRSHQLLAIDDLQQFPAGDYILQELRYTLDDYQARGATILVTSTQPIAALANISPDLRSRLSTGLVLQLSPPGDAARMRIIRHASHAMGRPLSEEATNRLARGVTGSANNLVGAVFELCNAADTAGRSDACRVEQLLTNHAARRPTLREIVAVVARYQGVPQSHLKSSSRRQSIVFTRAIVVYLARELASASYDQIGRALGGRDHTTIIHNYRKIERQRECDPQTQQTLENLRRILLSR